MDTRTRSPATPLKWLNSARCSAIFSGAVSPVIMRHMLRRIPASATVWAMVSLIMYASAKQVVPVRSASMQLI